MAVLRVRPGRALRVYGETLDQLKWATLTVVTVLALAYVMNLSGQTITLGLWVAGAGGVFAFLSPIIGWLGVAVTGSDTSSNSLFGALQVTAAQGGRARPDAAGGGQQLGRRARQDDLAAEPGDRRRGGRHGRQGGRAVPQGVGWSLAAAPVMCVLVYLQSTACCPGWCVVSSAELARRAVAELRRRGRSYTQRAPAADLRVRRAAAVRASRRRGGAARHRRARCGGRARLRRGRRAVGGARRRAPACPAARCPSRTAC